MELREEIGLRLKQARLDKHMTQQEVVENWEWCRPLTYDTKRQSRIGLR